MPTAPPRFARLIAAVAAAASLTTSGCRGQSAGVWTNLAADWNRYRACTLRIENRDHLPTRTDHIRHMRWTHGEPPVLPHCDERFLHDPKHSRIKREL